MKAVAYFRVSTAAQGRSALGLEAQRAEVAEFAAQRGAEILASFVEVESGKRNDRPELVKALSHAKLTGATLLIAKLDRLSRNAAFLLTLRDSGVQFRAADIPDANDLTIGVMAVIAQAEREAISKRTKEALASVRVRLSEHGLHVSSRTGRTVARLGNPKGTEAIQRAGRSNLNAIATCKLGADRRARELAAVIHDVRAQGVKSYARIAKVLNDSGILTPRGGKWHASTVRQLVFRIEAQAAPRGHDDPRV